MHAAMDRGDGHNVASYCHRPGAPTVNPPLRTDTTFR
ncbi:MAG: hypothetical protein JWL68_4377 [Actinomycetia bacterium]|jgi:hypothetical protein|nr:hypothetical protein [Actinomycetes bacterium]